MRFLMDGERRQAVSPKAAACRSATMNGEVIGAVGVTGDTEDNDEELACTASMPSG